MNYRNPELLDRLAAEYVLGTLRGQARARFERILVELPEAKAAVADWQQRLAGLADALPEQQPSKHVWRRIENDINPGRVTDAGFWRPWAILASTALLAVLVYQFMQAVPEVDLPDQQVAFVNEANQTPLWVVSMDFDTGELSTRAVSAQAREIDKVYELWMLPETGNPRSLGLLPVDGGQSKRTFSPALLDLLRNAQGLAVSIEPKGGSTTGVPTGPVVYQAALVPL